MVKMTHQMCPGANPGHATCGLRPAQHDGRWTMGRVWSGLIGGALGAVATLLLDPARGRSRRARLRDQGAATVRRAWRSGSRRRRMLGSRAAGMIGALRSGMLAEAKDRERPSDPTLRDRVESELLRDPKVPKGSININA